MAHFDAASWLDDWLLAYPWATAAPAAPAELVRAALALPKSAQVALHKTAVARLPALRGAADDPDRWHKGNAVYELACRLYGRRLPYTEEDVCALLHASKHDCGHGEDVKPPFELGLKWARANGVSPAWLAAVRDFVEGLKGLTAVRANDLKTRGGLVLLLDTERAAATRCHSERFRDDLARMAAAERGAWERLVLHMGTHMGSRLPKGYDVEARALAASLGTDTVLGRLDQWLPDPEQGAPCKLATAGSHLFTHFVWLLLVISSDATVASRCDALVERLTRVEFKPAEPGKKIAFACAVYFAQRPPAVAKQPHARLLERVLAMDKRAFDSDRMRRIIEDSLAKP